MTPSDAQKQWLIDHDFFDHAFLQILTGQVQLNPELDLCEALARHGRLSPEQANYIRQQASAAASSPTPMGPQSFEAPSIQPSAHSLEFPGYKVSGELGRGGMGVVYSGEQEGTSAEVVIKCLINGDSDLDLISRFHREARVLAQFSHKNIVTIKDFGTQAGQPYMVMNRVPGQDLKRCIMDHFTKSKTLPPLTWVLPIMIDVAEALAACHEKGIAHRDLKPENIMIEDESETPIIIDFGLAQVGEGSKSSTILESLGNKLTKTGEVLGTPAYMAPEQLDETGQTSVNEKADVWGFGATLFFCLTGRAPYIGNSAYAIYRQLIENDPPPPSTLNPELPPWLDTLCQDAMTRSSQQRPTMKDISLRLREGKPRSQWLHKALLGVTIALLIVFGVLAVKLVFEDQTPPTRPQLRLSAKFPGTQSKTQDVLYTKNPKLWLSFESKEKNPGYVSLRNDRETEKRRRGKLNRDGLYQLKVPLFVGKNTLQVRVIDQSGNHSPATTLTVYRTILSPRITQIVPPDTLQSIGTRAFRFQVSGRLNQNGCQISYNGHDAKMSGRNFIQDIEFTGTKSSQLALTLKDPYGEEARHPLSIAIVNNNARGPRTHKTISSAVNMAKNGARIFVLPGNYVDSLKINKSLNIIGVGEEVTVCPNRGNALEILDEATVRIGNLQISCPETSAEALVTLNSGRLTLEKCLLKSGNRTMITCGLKPESQTKLQPRLTLQRCLIWRRSFYGIVIQSAQLMVDGCQFFDKRMHGLVEYDDDKIDDKSVYSKQASLMIGPGAKLTLTNSRFKVVKDRHLAITGGHADLVNCQFGKSYQEAISFGWQSSGTVKKIHCSKHTQEALLGINCKTVDIDDSIFEDGDIGYLDDKVGTETSRRFPALTFATAGTFTLRNCIVRRNSGWGLHIRGESSAVTVTLQKCQILDNKRTGVIQNSGELIVRETLIANNTGHGLHVKSAKAFCQDSEFKKNSLDGIYGADHSRITLVRVKSFDNTRGPASHDETSSIKVLD